jgi:predicted dehydrogenase
MTIGIALIGFGKIARDEHLPAIARDPRFRLVAVSTPGGDPEIGVPWFADVASLIAGMGNAFDAAAICTPPAVRHGIAVALIAAGKAVLLEKPPAATLGEIDDIERQAQAAGTALYASWHSQHACAVPQARAMLAGEEVTSLAIRWREDVRKFHPGQQWIWQPGGFGVFDPGINGLSIATRILPRPLFVRSAELVFPENRQAPIAADIVFAGDDMRAEFDWREQHGECWSITVATASGRRFELVDGGERLLVDGETMSSDCLSGYPAIYDHFASVVEDGRIAVDREPLRIVADAFLIGRRTLTGAFVEP